MSVLSYGYPTGPFRRNNQWIAERGQDNAEELWVYTIQTHPSMKSTRNRWRLMPMTGSFFCFCSWGVSGWWAGDPAPRCLTEFVSSLSSLVPIFSFIWKTIGQESGTTLREGPALSFLSYFLSFSFTSGISTTRIFFLTGGEWCPRGREWKVRKIWVP